MIQKLIENLEKNKSFENYFKVGAYYFEEEGNPQKAKIYIEEALTLSADNPEANHYWSLILFEESKYKDNRKEELETLNLALSFAIKAYNTKPELEDIFYMATSPIKRRIAEIQK